MREFLSNKKVLLFNAIFKSVIISFTISYISE
jgi:hypothetical protein